MAEIKQALAELDPDQQREVSAYLLHLRLSRDTEWRAEMTRRIDDKTSENWVALDAVKQSLD